MKRNKRKAAVPKTAGKITTPAKPDRAPVAIVVPINGIPEKVVFSRVNMQTDVDRVQRVLSGSWPSVEGMEFTTRFSVRGVPESNFWKVWRGAEFDWVGSDALQMGFPVDLQLPDDEIRLITEYLVAKVRGYVGWRLVEVPAA